jgi:CelD/BcsL family acetyltransferase involved in cellulose biosynthesis
VSGKLRLVVLREIPDDENLRRDWNALVGRAPQPQVFYTYEWARAVQHAYGSTLRPLIFLAYDQPDTLCGLVALATSANEAASFLCATTGDYCDFISLPEHRASFVAEVLAALRRESVSEIRLANLPADSASVQALHRASCSEHYQYFARTAYICAQVSLASLQRRGENKPVLPRKKMLRRFLNAMGREGPVRLEHARSWEQAALVLPGFIEAHIARFLVTGRISNLARAERRVFLEELAKLLSERGCFALTTFVAGKKVYAWNYGFQFLDTWFWYQPTFDSDFEKYSPGFCLLAKLIEEAADKPDLQTVDLGLGAEEYKERFANRTRETLYVTLGTSSLAHLREIGRYYISTGVKKLPVAERVARSILADVDTLKQRLRTSGVLATCRWAAKRLRNSMVRRDEVCFYELNHSDLTTATTAGLGLRLIDLNTLAVAAMQNENDEGTLAYLLRCARHLRNGQWKGFALVNSSGEFLHFTWAGPFDGFHCSEVAAKLNSPASGSILLFDSWTPVSRRGKQYYSTTIDWVARALLSEGKRSWIFSASTNISSIRALKRAGFKRCFSLIRYRVLWWQRVMQEKFVAI